MSAVESCRPRCWFNRVVDWRQMSVRSCSIELCYTCLHTLDVHRFHTIHHVQQI